MDLGLKDKIIVVTGGAKGIGRGIVTVLSREGATAVVVGRSEEDNNKVIGEVEAAGGKAFAVVAELTRPEACEAAIKTVLKKFGKILPTTQN